MKSYDIIWFDSLIDFSPLQLKYEIILYSNVIFKLNNVIYLLYIRAICCRITWHASRSSSSLYKIGKHIYVFRTCCIFLVGELSSSKCCLLIDALKQNSLIHTLYALKFQQKSCCQTYTINIFTPKEKLFFFWCNFIIVFVYFNT